MILVREANDKGGPRECSLWSSAAIILRFDRGKGGRGREEYPRERDDGLLSASVIRWLDRMFPRVKTGTMVVGWHCLLARLRPAKPCLKVERGGVNAVPEASWLRPILEAVAEMSIALFAEHFGPRRDETGVHVGLDVLFVYRLVEAWPTGPRVIFVLESNKELPQHMHLYIPDPL